MTFPACLTQKELQAPRLFHDLLSNLVDERASGGGGLGFESVDELNSGDHVGQELGAV